jgi:hypothetical protein
MERLEKVLADTGGIIASLDPTDDNYLNVVEVILSSEVIIPATILPEVDYLATKYFGETVSRLFFEDLTEETYSYLNLTSVELPSVINLMKQYSDFPIGFVDASITVLADNHKIKNILTLDHRHFSIIPSKVYGTFNLLP